MTDRPRSYRSPLREAQAQRTRDLVLDGFTELLATRRADDITANDIAEQAGVSPPTVYRHFPDRAALLKGLADRVDQLTGPSLPPAATLDDLGPRVEAVFGEFELHREAVRAEALLNADPRSFGELTSRRSQELVEIVAAAFPDDDQRQVAIAGLLRCLGSAQSWLRMREEFGVTGTESGPLFRWAIETLIREIRTNGYPAPTTGADGERQGQAELEGR